MAAPQNFGRMAPALIEKSTNRAKYSLFQERLEAPWYPQKPNKPAQTICGPLWARPSQPQNDPGYPAGWRTRGHAMGTARRNTLNAPPGEDEPTKMWPIMTKPTVTLTKERSLPWNGVSGGSGRRPSYKKDTNS